MRYRINPTRSEGQDGDLWELTLADLRGHIHAFGNFGKLAELACLNCTTISNLASGKTSSPHMRTVMKIMDAIGRAKPVREAMRCDTPVSLSEARLRIPIRKKINARVKSRTKAQRFVRVSAQKAAV